MADTQQQIALTQAPIYIDKPGSLQITFTPNAAAQPALDAAATQHALTKPQCTCYYPGRDMKFHHFCAKRCCKRRYFEAPWPPHPDHLPVCHWYCFIEMRDKLVEVVMQDEGKLQVDGVEDVRQLPNGNLMVNATLSG